MEYEVRFYYSKEKIEEIIQNLDGMNELTKKLRTYEKTIQYNHSDKRYDFYDKEIDGRFRLRISSNEKKEVRINPEDIDNFIFIINNVMHFEVVESYERYRTVYENEDIEVSLDEYPFGVCVEIENKSLTKNPEEVVKTWVDKLGLNINNAI